MRTKHVPDPEFDVPMMVEQGGVLYLHFDSPWAQGAMSLSDPNSLVFLYTQQMCAWLLFEAADSESAIALLGLGAGSHFRFLQKHTNSPVLAVEWNELVIMCVEDHFHVATDERCQIVEANAEKWVHETSVQGQYRFLMVDLYDYTAEGPVCSSKKFYKGCANILGKDGIASFNLFGHHPSFPKNLANIRAAFDGRVMMFPETVDGNRVVLAFKGANRVYGREELALRAQHMQLIYGLPGAEFLDSLLQEPANHFVIRDNKIII
ncbi:hypothetical protein QP097_04850 [Oligella urethralis]|uniref:hypothetical protein n=1 Tax=Oligella urethralis TaxID=90245 RepID=UPI00254B638D|nr:hypothetical protein [Oligella urethralis]MDK6202798.1 hypothetical protein [Oligella urethralis]